MYTHHIYIINMLYTHPNIHIYIYMFVCIYKCTYDEWSPKGRKWGLIDGHITRVYIQCEYKYIYITSSELRILSSAVPLDRTRTHTYTHRRSPYIQTISDRANERGNSHLRATIKTIDDWRGHLDLKIYLRGSASHIHTHTHTYTRTLKRDWIIDQLSPSFSSGHPPTLPFLCRGVSCAPYPYIIYIYDIYVYYVYRRGF